MPRHSNGAVRVDIGAETANEVMDLVRAGHSTRSRVIRNAVHLYLKLSEVARGGELVVYQDDQPVWDISLPWDEGWDGLPERVEDQEIPHIQDPEAYRNRQYEEPA